MDVCCVIFLLSFICYLKLGDSSFINAQANDGNTALHIGVQYDRMEISELLIQRGGADVNIQNNKMQAPLHLAVDLQRIRIMKLLVRQGANLSLRDEDGNSPLHLALLNDIENNVENENDVQSHCGNQFVEESKDEKSFAYIACFLVSQGANLNLMNNNGQTPLDLCNKLKSCDKNNAIYRNWDIDTKDNQGNTALHLCASLNRIEISEILIEHGANMDLRNFDLKTALHIAVDFRRVEIMEKLVSNGCNMTLQDEDGNTALHIAVNHYLEIFGDNPQDSSLCDQQTDVSLAALKSYPYMACYLLSHKADGNIKNYKNETPFQLCPGLRKCITETEK